MLFSKLDYASYLSYSPHGTTTAANKSKTWMHLIKQERLVSDPPVPSSEYIARKLADEFENLPFKDFFGEDVSLVPVPKSSLMKKETLWVPHRLVQALCKFSLGKEFNCLTRTEPVIKSASAKSADRPKPIDHYKTISVRKGLETPKCILSLMML